MFRRCFKPSCFFKTYKEFDEPQSLPATCPRYGISVSYAKSSPNDEPEPVEMVELDDDMRESYEKVLRLEYGIKWN